MDLSEEWILFHKTGLPWDPKKRWKSPTKVVAIGIDSDDFIAVDQFHQIYTFGHRMFGYKGKRKEYYKDWHTSWGAPFRGDLFMPSDTISFDVGRNNYESLYYQDSAKNHHESVGIVQK